MSRAAIALALLLLAGCGGASQAPRERHCAIEIMVRNYVPGLRGHQLYTYADQTYHVGTVVRDEGPLGTFEFSMTDTADGSVEIHWLFVPNRAVSADARSLYERRLTTSRDTIVEIDSGRVRASIRPARTAGR